MGAKMHISLDSWWWRFLERYVYAMPDPPPPRTRSRPMEVICVGLPRSGTESLQQALLTLGYDHTYHGWDIVYDEDCYSPGWVALARRKWFGRRDPSRPRPSSGYGSSEKGSLLASATGDDAAGTITAADFDALLGHSVAVTDAAASVFAAEMIAAYPEAKVVLNMRRDTEAWHRSVIKTLVMVNESWAFWLASLLDRECFWAWHVYERFMWPLLFRAPDGDMANAIRKNAKWVSREHCNMIRGLVPKERLLEWYVEDGWEPLCRFLGKSVPDVEFPHANAATGGWKAREEQCAKRWIEGAFRRLFFLLILLFGLIALVVRTRYFA